MRIIRNIYTGPTVLAAAALLLVAACGQKEEASSKPAAAKSESTMQAEVPITTSSDAARKSFLEGRALLDGLHFTDAHAKFLAAVEADPDFAMAHVMTALTSQSAEEFFKHVNLANATAAGASDGEKLYVEALVASAENDQAAQGAALKKLVGAYPKDARTHMALGNFLNGQQDFADAAMHFTHATEIAPGFAPAFNSLGYAYRSLDDLDQANSAFEKYVQLEPQEANPHDSYAELLMEMGNYDESIKHYQMATDIDPHFLSAYGGVSRNYSLMGNAEKSQEAAAQMLAASRNFAERQNAMFASVTSQLFAGNHDAAMQTSSKMAAEAEEQGDHSAASGVHDYMGDIELNAGNTAAAAEHYAMALALAEKANINEANKAQARRNNMFKMATVAMVAEDAALAGERTDAYAAAVEDSGTAFERRRAHELMGYMSMINEDMAAGVQHLAQAGQFNPHVLYWSAVAHNDLGDKAKARDLFTRAANRNTLSQNLPFVRAKALAALDKMNES
ncbi:MAG: tetratricopeptide repeat protein [Woeseia sp.]